MNNGHAAPSIDIILKTAVIPPFSIITIPSNSTLDYLCWVEFIHY